METVISTNNLNVKFADTLALKDVELSIPKGDYVAIIGPNGGGKTTLLRTLIGLQKQSSGTVKLFGKQPKKTHSKVGFVPQFANLNRKFPISVFEAVCTGALTGGFHPFFKYNKDIKENAFVQMQRLGIDHLHQRGIAKLSGGEFQRMLIARALMNNPEMLMLDEPTASVDPASRELIYDLLGEINKTSTIIMVSHDLVAVASNVKSIICLNKTLIYHGEPSLSEETVSKLYGCPIDLIAHGVPHRVLPHHTHEGDHKHVWNNF